MQHISLAISPAIILIILLRWGWKLLNWLWLQPSNLEKSLRELGFRGNSYRLLFGDMKEILKMDEESKSKPIKFSHDIVPRIMPFIHKTIIDYGKNCFIWLGPNPAMLITEPELIREILSKSNIFQKPLPTALTKLLAEGILSYEADKWAKHRRIINPAFHLDKLKHMVPSFHLTTCEMLSKWEKIVSTEGSEVDVWPYLQTLTSDAISRTAFGSSYEEGRKIFELQQELAKIILKGTESSYISFLPTKEKRRMNRIHQEVKLLILRIINKRMNEIETGEASNSDDLLGILLESNLKEIQENGNKKFGMSIDEVIEECKLFYFAGQETTSALLTWSMIVLSKHSNWQARAREEVWQIFGNNMPDYDKLNQLKVVTTIIQEVLRLYPPLFLMGREVNKETKLGNLTLPSGLQLVLPTILLHHDQEIWGEDVKEFNPDRFSEGVNKATKGKFAYFPFSWGPRNCIGQNFAMLEAKMALAMILEHYAFEVSPSYAHVPYSVLTLQPQYGAQLILQKL
ncbi:cytochrome P450 CYP72A219-like [Lycium ferocissimum]|uniref:cytochrome P450 CYP72A219-like n=1 Tax=Lycium ferocissimum TaxID=112874 RepID=UPI0028162CF1|nr:cytochrome P450 CYP72A219-like [Lycium ferocissimum]